MPKSSDQNFKVFHEEVTSQDAMQADRTWRKHNRHSRNHKYTKVLFLVVLVMAIILGLVLSMLEKHHPEHRKSQFSDRMWRVESLMPHLVFLVEKEASGREARDMVSLGMAHGGLVSWLEGNLRADWRVLLVPNQPAGVNVLGVTAAYYLTEGSLSMVAKDSEYIQMTQDNMQVMKEKHSNRSFEVQLLSQYPRDTIYDLVIIQRNTLHQHINTNTTSRIIMVHRQSAQSSIIKNSFGQYRAFEIIKGKICKEIREEGRKVGYAVLPYVAKSEMKDVAVLLENEVKGFGPSLCPEQDEIRGESESMSVVEYLRNHTIQHIPLKIYYSASSKRLLSKLGAQLKDSASVYVPKGTGLFTQYSTSVQSIGQAIDNEQQDLGKTKQLVVITEAGSTLPVLTNTTTVLVHITSPAQLQLYASLSHFTTFLSPNTNNGCFYPPSILHFTPSIPFYLILSPLY